MTLVWILLATFFGGALSAALASLFLLLSETRRSWLLRAANLRDSNSSRFRRPRCAREG